MNAQLSDFLKYILKNRKVSHLHLWMHLLLNSKSGTIEMPFYEIQGLFGVSRPTLYRILEDGKSFGVESMSRKKVLVVVFPSEWSGVQKLPKPEVTEEQKPLVMLHEQIVDIGKACHQSCIKLYADWYDERIGVMPQILAADASGMKSIVKYLIKAVKAKSPNLTDAEVVDRVERAWVLILNKWNTLTPFLQSQVKISQINSNLTNILHAIKNPKVDKASNRASRFAETEINLNSDSDFQQ